MRIPVTCRVFSSKGVSVLTLLADQPECLWDDVLPVEVKELPEDLAALDVLLADQELLWPLVERWRQEFAQTGRAVLTEGRPTIAMEIYVRMMLLNPDEVGAFRKYQSHWVDRQPRQLRRAVVSEP